MASAPLRSRTATVHYEYRFRLEIGRGADNTYLIPGLRRLRLDHARRGKIFYRPTPPDNMLRDMSTAVHPHDLIIDAIAA